MKFKLKANTIEETVKCKDDFSCLNGFCPSFVTVEGAQKAQKKAAAGIDMPAALYAGLPQPELPPIDGAYDLLVTGVGGTGVVTVGQLITMAAHLEGKGASVLDFMGFAQKFGPVLSYIRIARTGPRVTRRNVLTPR